MRVYLCTMASSPLAEEDRTPFERLPLRMRASLTPWEAGASVRASVLKSGSLLFRLLRILVSFRPEGDEKKDAWLMGDV